MRYLKILHVAFTALLLLPFFGKQATAGCPALPPEERHITVAECRFYDAVQDLELQKKVDQHFADWQDANAGQIQPHKNAVYERNTGTIVTALNPDGSRFELFYRTASPDLCAAYPAGETQTVFTVRTCRMVFFAAPTELVIVPEPPAADRHYYRPVQPEERQ